MRPIQFFLLVFAAIALAKVVHSYKQWGMRTPNFLFWIIVWVGTACIISFPDATSILASLVGVGRGADLIIYASLIVSFYLIFRIHLTLARLEQEITELVRAIALERLAERRDSAPQEGD